MHKKYENKILLVDDDTKNLQVAMSILKDYNVIYAQSGEKALELLEKNQFDLILLDVVMPIMDGYYVCSKIKANDKTKKIPIIFLTVKDDEKDIVKGFELGAVDYIIKPFYSEVLLKRVEVHLKLASAMNEIEQINLNLNEIVNNQIKELRQKDEIIVQQSKISAIASVIDIISVQWKKPLDKIKLYLQSLDFRMANLEEFKDDNIFQKTLKQVNKLDESMLDFHKFFNNQKNKEDVNLKVALDNAIFLQKDRIKKLKTFSIGFYEKKYNEAHYAKDISKHLGTEHTEYYCTQKDAQDLLPLIGDIWDEPFGDKSNIPTLLVSKLARKEVTVSLSADGGDEVFGGYGKYTEILKYNKLFSKRPISNNIANLLDFIDVRSFFGQNKSYKFLNKYERFKLTLKAENEIDVLKNSIYCFLPSEVKKLLNNFEKNIETCFDDIRFLNQNNDSLDKIMAIDYKTYQLDDILVKVDRATMSVGLEGREPLLDHRIIEFVSTLPSKYKIKNGEKKYILKEIVHNYIPKELMDRPKMGFGFPLKEWFGDELKKYILEYLDSEKITKIGLLNVQEVEVLKKDWLVNNRNLNKLWLILNFVMWYERNI